MMSVPVINSVLPTSGNQPAKINSSQTASSSVSPLGISVPSKLSVIPPPQIQTSPNKPPLGVNHSQVPLSLVYENKVVGSQGQPAIAKPTTDKPKDLSPSKPTSNGVETTVKTPSNTQEPQPAAAVTTTIITTTATTTTVTTTTTTTLPNSKAEDSSLQKGSVNHSEEKSPLKSESAPSSDEPASSSTQPQSTILEKVETCKSVSKEAEKSTQESTKEEKETKLLTGGEKSAESNNEKAEEKAAVTGQANKRKREQKPEEKKDDEPEPEKKTRRIRSQVLPYQSPLPELATFINKSLKEKDASQKSNEEKLIVFYKNEFLAVRNAEGGFYLCQTLQNVYRTSHRIRIRWLSQKKEGSGEEGDIYAPDFYDLTDFECILTTVALSKMEKNMYKLRKVELERIENILKRALDVEKGVTEKPSITEEHPDGIDLSLYKDESQLQKPKKALKKKASSPDGKSPKQAKKSGGGETPTRSQTTRTTSRRANSKTEKKITKTASKKVKGKKGKSESSKSKAVDQLKVSPPNEKARVVAKVLRKFDIIPVKETTTKKAKSKTAKRSSASKSQKKKGQKSGKKMSQVVEKDEPAQSHHERRQGKNKYSNNKNKKN